MRAINTKPNKKMNNTDHLDLAKILLYINDDGKAVYGYPQAPKPIPVTEWVAQVNAAAEWIQGSVMSEEQFKTAMQTNDAVRQAVRRLFGELAEDAYYLREIPRSHWKLAAAREEKLEQYIQERSA